MTVSPDLSRLSEAELRALRATLDLLIPAAGAVVQFGGEADIFLSIECGAAAAIIVLSTEVQE